MGRPKGGKNKYWSKEEKLKLVKEHLEQHVSTLEITTRENISNGMYNNWLKKYLEQGEVGLENKKKPGNPLSKYIDNIVIDKTDTGSLNIKQINFRSSFIDKAVKLTQVGAYDYKLPFEVNHKQEMVLVSSPMKRKQVNKYLGYLREYFDIEYREDKGDRTENGMTIFDSAIPDNYELLKVIPIIDLNLFKGKDITFGLVFRPTIKEIINEK